MTKTLKLSGVSLSLHPIPPSGYWDDVNLHRDVEYYNFLPPFPSGGPGLNCATLLADGTWADAECGLATCGACQTDPAQVPDGSGSGCREQMK